MLRNLYRTLSLGLLIFVGIPYISAMQEQRSEIESTQNKFGRIGPIIIDPLIERLQKDTLVRLSVTSKALALKTEEQFTKRSPIKKPLPLKFSKEQDTSVWQPAKHSYFLRIQFEEALRDLREDCCTYRRDYESRRQYAEEKHLTIEFYRDDNGQLYEFEGISRVILEFPEYCRLHGFIGDTFFEILINDTRIFEDDQANVKKATQFAKQLKRGVEKKDPISLEVAWAIKCYHLNGIMLKTGQRGRDWNRQLEPLFDLTIFEDPTPISYANRLLDFSKRLALSGVEEIDEIKDHYGIQIDKVSLKKMHDAYEYQKKKQPTEIRYTREYERYKKLLKQKQAL